MKRKLFILSAVLLALLVSGFIAIYIWIDFDVKENINTAKAKYSGTAEDALIAYLLDTDNSPQDRSRVAVWTLGQIHSEKAL